MWFKCKTRSILTFNWLVCFSSLGSGFYIFFRRHFHFCLKVLLCIVFSWTYISWQATKEASRNHEAYLLFPVHLDGTLLDNAQAMKAKKEALSTTDVLHIFQQVQRPSFLFSIYLGSDPPANQFPQLRIVCFPWNICFEKRNKESVSKSEKGVAEPLE